MRINIDFIYWIMFCKYNSSVIWYNNTIIISYNQCTSSKIIDSYIWKWKV